MAKLVGSALDLQQIPVQRLVPHKGSTAPSSPVDGQLWVDTTTDPARLKVYEGSTLTWVLASQTGAELLANKGTANGYAGLNSSSEVALSNLPVASSGTSSSTKLVRADDSRLSDSRTPSGSAGGDLTGTYPNPTIASGAVTASKIATGTITDTQVATANKDGLAATPSLRTLGTGAQQAMAGNTTLSSIAAPTGSVSLNSQKITNLADPTSAQDAATKAYVDGVSQGLDVKASVRAASTANLTGITYNATSGASGRGQITTAPNSLDGVSLNAGDRILLKDQTTGAQRGIYTVTTVGSGSTGVWDRATDFDSDAEVTAGAFVFVEEGASNADTGWVLTTNDPITIGGASGTALTFTQFSSAGAYIAGNGLTLTGNTFDVGGTANRITVNADTVDIASTYVGQTSITTVSNTTGITTGAWKATAVDIPYGGTNATTAAGARTNLGATGKYAADLGALTAGSAATITHSLNTRDVTVSFRDISGGTSSQPEVLLDWKVTGLDTIQVTSDIAYSSGVIRVVVVG